MAPLASVIQSDRVCWATNTNYLSEYELQIDNVGGYREKISFLWRCPQNERIFTDFFHACETVYHFGRLLLFLGRVERAN